MSTVGPDPRMSTEPPRQPLSGMAPTHVRYFVLGLVAFASTSAYLTRHCLAVLNTTIQEDLQFSDEQMGWVFSAYAMGYFLFQVPGGWLGTKFGTRGVFATISVLWSLTTVWTSAVFSFVPMAASRLTFGLAQAGLVPLSSQIVKDWFPVNRRSGASGLITAGMSVGGVITMMLTAQLIEHLDWRQILQIYSLVGIAWSIAFYLYFRTRPQDHRLVNEGELKVIAGGEAAPTPVLETATEPVHAEESILADEAREQVNPYQSPTSATPSPVRMDSQGEPVYSTGEIVQAMLSSRSMWAVCIQAALRAAGYTLLVSWFPAYMEKAFQISKTHAGYLSTPPLVGVVIGSLLGGFVIDALLDATNNKWISRSGVAAFALLMCAAGTLASAMFSDVNYFVGAITFGAFFFGFTNPATWAATMDIAGKHTAPVMGVMNMASSIGGMIIPVVLGYMIGYIEASQGDWNLVLYLFTAIHFLAAVSWLAMNPYEKATEPRG